MSTPEASPSASHNQARAYWKANIRLVLMLMAVWFLVSFGAGILFVEQLNQIHIGGFPLGFWMGQQGAIFVFMALILIYALRMRQLDRKFGVDESSDEPGDEVDPHDL
jgi:putative solute:sodium symporter small subunit